LFLFIAIYLAFLTSYAQAEKVQLSIHKNIIANADYYEGDNNRSAILIIHGFLQTNNFYTVRRLFDALAESGHSVLSPNLSLGISNRKKSLACEAIHTHTIEDDAKEIALWVEWLFQKTHKPVILIAHSAGSLSALAYLSSVSNATVQKAILISLYTFGPGAAAYETELDQFKAREALRNNDQQLHEFGLSFCKKYVSSAKHYLSYYNWSSAKVNEALQKPLLNRISKTVIIGSSDKKINRPWVNTLKRQQINFIEVEGANHFFDQQHEFDLLDAIEDLLP